MSELHMLEVSPRPSRSMVISKQFQLVEIPEKLKTVLTANETVAAAVRQHWTFAPLYPSTVALTDRRLIIHKPTLFGCMKLVDFLWRDGLKVHVQAHMITSSLTIAANCREVNGECQKVTIKIPGLEKEPALLLYAQAQQLEEQWREFIRAEEIKRLYAESGGTVINTNPMATMNSAQARLEMLKSFHEQGMISYAEYEAIKADIVSRM